MARSSDNPDRQSIRMRDYDYTNPGYYCFTICVQDRKHVFGYILRDQMQPNSVGQIILDVWQSFSQRYRHVERDSFQLMPNHVHGILALTEPTLPTTAMNVPQRFQPHMQALQARKMFPPLGEILRVFKAISTYRIHKYGMNDFAWQDRYHEFILRSEKELDRARHYVVMNPVRWARDPFHASDEM